MTSAAAQGLHSLSTKLATSFLSKSESKKSWLKLVAAPEPSPDRHPLSGRHIFRREESGLDDEEQSPPNDAFARTHSKTVPLAEDMDTPRGSPTDESPVNNIGEETNYDRAPLSARISFSSTKEDEDSTLTSKKSTSTSRTSSRSSCFSVVQVTNKSRYSLERSAAVGAAYADPTKKPRATIAGTKATNLTPPPAGADDGNVVLKQRTTIPIMRATELMPPPRPPRRAASFTVGGSGSVAKIPTAGLKSLFRRAATTSLIDSGGDKNLKPTALQKQSSFSNSAGPEIRSFPPWKKEKEMLFQSARNVKNTKAPVSNDSESQECSIEEDQELSLDEDFSLPPSGKVFLQPGGVVAAATSTTSTTASYHLSPTRSTFTVGSTLSENHNPMKLLDPVNEMTPPRDSVFRDRWEEEEEDESKSVQETESITAEEAAFAAKAPKDRFSLRRIVFGSKRSASKVIPDVVA
ncbi:unnamed protein product [Amoebophrya sp. A120]|nr:unnamed protein product [Amoebophrya sp. A120]|eukprot:GSA120T00003432001.1